MECIECLVCAQSPILAVETECCGRIACELCLKNVEDDQCPGCSQPGLIFHPNRSIRRLLDNRTTPCPNKCGVTVSVTELVKHLEVCVVPDYVCPAPECFFKSKKKDMYLSHMISDHHHDIIVKAHKLFTHSDVASTQTELSTTETSTQIELNTSECSAQTELSTTEASTQIEVSTEDINTQTEVASTISTDTQTPVITSVVMDTQTELCISDQGAQTELSCGEVPSTQTTIITSDRSCQTSGSEALKTFGDSVETVDTSITNGQIRLETRRVTKQRLQGKLNDNVNGTDINDTNETLQRSNDEKERSTGWIPAQDVLKYVVPPGYSLELEVENDEMTDDEKGVNLKDMRINNKALPDSYVVCDVFNKRQERIGYVTDKALHVNSNGVMAKLAGYQNDEDQACTSCRRFLQACVHCRRLL